MKHHVISAAIWAATSTLALAGDQQIAAHDWSGVYIGAHVGAAGSNFSGSYDDDGYTNHDFVRDGGGPFALHSRGAVGGLQVGHNWQSENIVYGIEGDISLGGWTDTLDNTPSGGTPESVTVDARYIATLRARAGFSSNRALIYGTVGVALTDTKFSANDDITKQDPAEMGSVALDKLGGVVGGGVEYALSDGWSVKAEGLYFLFNDNKDTYALTDDMDAGNFIQHNNSFTLKLGVNYSF